jgi:uncharacterized protein DUF4326
MIDARPVRLRLARAKGFSLQAISVATNGLPAMKVDRSTGFGNPFSITKGTSSSGGKTADVWTVGTWNGPAMWICYSAEEARIRSVEAYAAWVALPAQTWLRERIRIALRDKNLACWCKLPEPGQSDICHASVQIRIANRPICEAA